MVRRVAIDTVDAVIGGQAVVEGVLMRSDERWALSVRAPDGDIRRTGGATPDLPFARVPGLRGLAAIVTAMRLGMFALRWSVSVASPETVEVDKRAFRRSVVVALAIVLTIFVALPAVAAESSVGGAAASWAEALVRLSVVLAYLVAVGLLPQVRRVFQYHGAEHMAVSAHEAGLPLDVASAREQPMLHPRCGTTFIVVVALLSGLVHPALEHLGLDPVSARLVGLPVTIGLGYELLRAMASDRRALRPLRAVLIRLQRLTTRRPDDDQLEVALDALRAVSEDTARSDRVVVG